MPFAGQGYTGEAPAAEARKHSIDSGVVKLSEPKRAFALLPRRWVMERRLAWPARFRRLAKDCERLLPPSAGCTLSSSPVSCSPALSP